MGKDYRTSLGLTGWLLLASIGTSPLHAQRDATPPDAQKRAERLTYDPATGQWSQATAAQPGTEDGDLDAVRRHIAREDYPRARKTVKRWIKRYGPDAPRYPEALYLEGTAHLGCKDYRAADDAFAALLNDFPGSPFAEQALSGRFRVAEQYLAGKRRKAWGGLIKVKDQDGGIKILDDILVNYTDTPLAEQAQLTKADHYYDKGEFELAEDEYARFAREFPRSRYHAKSLVQSANAALAAFAGIKFDDASLIESQERFQQFRGVYPDLAEQIGVPVILDQIEASRADKTLSIADFYRRTGKFVAARYYYRQTVSRWPQTPAAAQAAQALERLPAASPGPPTEPAAAVHVEPPPAPQTTEPTAAAPEADADNVPPADTESP